MKQSITRADALPVIRPLDQAELEAVSGAGMWRTITDTATRGLETIDLIAYEVSRFVKVINRPQCK
jgi:hypothetical protein